MIDQPRWALLHGDTSPPPERTALRAGPLTAILEAGDLRYVRYGDVEVLRRVYVAVRDVNWRTPPMTVSELRVERGERTFSVRYAGRFQDGDIDFLARVAIHGSDDGTIRFELDGEARAKFRRNRIGICVLHPVEPCAGRPFQARKVDGSTELGGFSREISPHQPVHDLGTLTHEIVPGLAASVRFEGDTFEMEDQRNWTDASFKIYSTPLRLPFPVTVVAGERVRQAVTLSLVATALPPPPGPWPPALTFSVGAAGEDGDDAAAPLPAIGLGLPDSDEPLSVIEQDRLRGLHPAHLRVDLDAGDASCLARLRSAVLQAEQLGVPLEAALLVSPDDDAELAMLERLLRMVRPPVCRWLVFERGADAVTGPATIQRVRPLLREIAPGAPIVSGTDAYFTQLNRGRPPIDVLDGVCYSINGQVHAFDDTSLVETLQGQRWTVESARRIAGGLPLAIGPVTLRPRFNASATEDEPEPPIGARASSIDRRQMSLLGASWTAGSIAALATHGVGSLTYFETVGARGVLERSGGSPDIARFRSPHGGAFPLYHVLADVGEYAGGEASRGQSSQPLAVTGLVLRHGTRQRLLLANLTAERLSVPVEGLVGAWLVRILDETTVRAATAEPERFRSEAGQRRTVDGGRLAVDLRPYAVARLEQA